MQKKKEGEYKKPSKFKQLRSLIDLQTQTLWNEQQNYLKTKIIEADVFDWDVKTLKYIAGVDISFSQNHDDLASSALIIFDNIKKQVVYQDFQYVKLNYPYVPGFLAFRQVPSLLQLFNRLKKNKPQLWPQLVYVDGNGILHQNMCGLACHLGIILDVPTLGCGKTLFYVDGLTKQYVYQLCQDNLFKSGDSVNLVGKSKKIWAAAIRTTPNSSDPLFVSVGYKISLKTAVECVLSTCKYRIPEPIRQADLRSRDKIKKLDKLDKTQLGQIQIKQYDIIYLKPK